MNEPQLLTRPPDVVGRLYEALATGDTAALSTVLHPDVVLDVPGRHPGSGRYAGLTGILGFVGWTRDRAVETIEVVDVLEGRRHVAAVCLVRGLREGRTPLENHTVHLFELDEAGRIASIRFHNADQHAVDGFWG